MKGKVLGSLWTLISMPYSEDLHTSERVMESLRSIDQCPLNMDSVSTKKKGSGTRVVGDQSTEQKTLTRESVSDLEVTTMPQNQKMSAFPPLIRRKKQNWPLQILQHSSLPISTNQESPLINNLHPLWEQWLRLPQPQLS